MVLVLVISLFLVVFPVLWMSITGLISLAGGWRSLAKQFPGGELPPGRSTTYSFQSVNLSLLGNYRSCVHVSVGEAGVWMRPFFLYRFLHPPVFVPWQAMTGFRDETFLFRKGLAFQAGDRTVRLWGAAGEAVRQIAAGTPPY